MNELKQVFDFNGNNLEVVFDSKGYPLFNVNIICSILGFKSPRSILSHHVYAKDVVKTNTLTKIQSVIYVNELVSN